MYQLEGYFQAPGNSLHTTLGDNHVSNVKRIAPIANDSLNQEFSDKIRISLVAINRRIGWHA